MLPFAHHLNTTFTFFLFSFLYHYCAHADVCFLFSSSRIRRRGARSTFRGRAARIGVLLQRHRGPSGMRRRRDAAAAGPLAAGARRVDGQGCQGPNARGRQRHAGVLAVRRTPVHAERALGRVQVCGPQPRRYRGIPHRSSQSR